MHWTLRTHLQSEWFGSIALAHFLPLSSLFRHQSWQWERENPFASSITSTQVGCSSATLWVSDKGSNRSVTDSAAAVINTTITTTTAVLIDWLESRTRREKREAVHTARTLSKQTECECVCLCGPAAANAAHHRMQLLSIGLTVPSYPFPPILTECSQLCSGCPPPDEDESDNGQLALFPFNWLSPPPTAAKESFVSSLPNVQEFFSASQPASFNSNSAAQLPAVTVAVQCWPVMIRKREREEEEKGPRGVLQETEAVKIETFQPKKWTQKRNAHLAMRHTVITCSISSSSSSTHTRLLNGLSVCVLLKRCLHTIKH